MHVEQLFHYGSAVRRVMYTTNAIESVNSSFRKVTRKGAFHYAVVYVRNQLAVDDKIQARMLKYEQY